jgi:hypothetical protein
MELDVEVEKMFECLSRDGAHGALTDVCEHCVQQLAKQGGAYTCRTVCRSECTNSTTSAGNNRDKFEDIQARTTEPQTAHTVDCASSGILSVSITCLKNNGTCTFSSYYG